MDKLEKLFRRIPKQDRIRIQQALEQIFAKDFTGLRPQQLKGFEHIYRIRIGNYRVVYYSDGKEIILKAVKRKRSEFVA